MPLWHVSSSFVSQRDVVRLIIQGVYTEKDAHFSCLSHFQGLVVSLSTAVGGTWEWRGAGELVSSRGIPYRGGRILTSVKEV